MKIPSEKLSSNYIDFCKNSLNDAKNYIMNIKSIIQELIDYNQKYFKHLENSFNETINEIDNVLKSLKLLNEYNNDIKKDNLFENLKKKYKNCCSNISCFYENNYIKHIKEINENLDIIYKNICDFNPPDINYLMDSINEEIDYSELFYGSNSFSFNEKIKDNYKSIINSLKCCDCKKNEAKYIEQISQKILCEKCINNLKISSLYKVEIIEKNISEKEKNRNLFFNSTQNILKKIIMMINLILKNEKIKIINNDNKLNIDYILRIFKYPFIKNINDFESCLTFLNQINEILKNDLNITSINIDEFKISEIDKELIYIIGKILKDEKIELFKETIEILDNNFDLDNSFIDE